MPEKPIDMEVIFLGTGTSSGVPMIGCPCEVCTSEDRHDNRLRSSILLRWQDSTTIVIDTGPDFRYQMLREGVRRLDAVLLTHSHKDHIAGLDDIRAFNFLTKKAIPVYCTAETEDALRREFAYAFKVPAYPGIPQMDLHRIVDQPFSVGGKDFIPIQVRHARMEVLGFRTGAFAYITDANEIPEKEFGKLQNLGVLVLNALRKERHVSHFTLEEAIAIGRKTGAKKVFFTHVSHQLGLHAAVSKELPQNMHLAFDGLRLNL